MTVVISRDRRPAPSAAGKALSVSERTQAAGRSQTGGPLGGGDLYKKREPIYPKLVHGKWRNIKWAVLITTLGIYYITPWIRWERPESAPDQAVLVDLAHGRFYFFFIQLWPQEVYYVT